MSSLRARLLCGTACIAAVASVAGSSAAQAAAPLTPAWFAARVDNAASAAGRALPAAQSLQQVQRSIVNVQEAARAISAMRSAQAAARAAALAAPAGVPNGIGPGGLNPAAGYNAPGNSLAWTNATLQPQSVSGGRVQVTVTQTRPQALLNWQQFNVGPSTTLTFDQSAGGSAANTWVALNRVRDPSAQPSQILGQINAPGQVYVINANGIIFGGASQINVGSLIASTADLAQPLSSGIYGAAAFAGAAAASRVLVEAGAQITTNPPPSVTTAGGGVLLFARTVENDGSIATPNGQTVLASGTDFSLTQGAGTNGNTFATTRGTVVSASGAGRTVNAGLIEASTGDISLFGETVLQAGVAYATSSTATRGTLHLTTLATDRLGSVTLAPGSLTQIAPDPNATTALESQRAQGLSQLTGSAGTPDGPQTSRVEITAGGLVDFQGSSLTIANAGQIVVTAGTSNGSNYVNGRVLVESNAQLDVAGLVGVTLPMSANALAVSVQGFEQRDSPVNRDSKLLNSDNVYVDTRQLVLVPASGTGGAYASDRYYTAGGLLEVSGELSNTGHSIEEWDTVGGSITLQSGTVVAQPGAVFNIAGGTINYQSGYRPTTWLTATNGNLYSIDTAPSSLSYDGIFSGFKVTHPRWNVSDTYNNPLIAPSMIFEQGYTVGRDAGTLTISAPTTIFEGTIDAGVADGARQNAAHAAALTDAFLQAQNVVPLAGSLLLQQVTAENTGTTGNNTVTPVATDVIIDDDTAPIAAAIGATTTLPATRANTTIFSAASLSVAGLGDISVNIAGTTATTGGTGAASVVPSGKFTLAAPLTLASGGQVNVLATGDVTLASITARGGSVSVNQAVSGGTGSLTVGPGASLDTRGLWVNEAISPASAAGAAYLNGGTISLTSVGGLVLSPGSLLDVSSGALVSATGALRGGTGGSITLAADAVVSNTETPQTLPATLAGQIRAVGYNGGGTFTLAAPAIAIGDAVTAAAATQIVLPSSFFQSGFDAYHITGYGSATTTVGTTLPGVSVAPGTQVTVATPVYQGTATTPNVPTGSDPLQALAIVLLPVYTPDPLHATLTQRAGAAAGTTTLALTEAPQVQGAPAPGGGVLMGAGATIAVDPGKAVSLAAADQITILGSVRAPGGAITITNTGPMDEVALSGGVIGGEGGYVAGLSIWLGSDSALDVSGRAVTAADIYGRPYGVVPGGGTIQIGKSSGLSTAFVALRAGATLDASGSSALIDAEAGLGNPVLQTSESTAGTSRVESDGGSIAIASGSGIYLDGGLRAAAGGAGASGGALSLTLVTPAFAYKYTPNGASSSVNTTVPDAIRVPAEIIVDQTHIPSLPTALQPQAAAIAAGVPFLKAAIGVDQVSAGGFASLSLNSSDYVTFHGDVKLSLSRSASLNAYVIADGNANASVLLQAPYLNIGTPPAPYDADGILAFSVTANATSASHAAQGDAFFPPCLTGAGVCGTGTLTLAAGLIDIRSATTGAPNFGYDAIVNLNLAANGSQPTQAFDRPGFQDVNLVSSGDIRLSSTLINPGNLSLTAGQVYAPTGENGGATAGTYLTTTDAARNTRTTGYGTLTIARYPGTDPAPPLSADGALTFDAPVIEQGGIVRVPFGSITLGVYKQLQGVGTTRVDFLPGSITSVSGGGLSVPFGGTTDGINDAGRRRAVWRRRSRSWRNR